MLIGSSFVSVAMAGAVLKRPIGLEASSDRMLEGT